ncbi:unnamed protein product [Linum trigynum]|uniref:Uncharacterized protein n=1 Tax=Linum trigynum TaxID=586398 RepID=A0AAV2E320_9ROSI
MSSSCSRKGLKEMVALGMQSLTPAGSAKSPGQALNFFKHMRILGCAPNEITFAGVLGSCGDCLALVFVKQTHGLVVRYGFSGNVILETSLVDDYGKCKAMRAARRIFDEIEFPNDVTCNVLVRRYLGALLLCYIILVL